jgi:hypothetical protein
LFVRVSASAADIAAFAEHRPVSADFAAAYAQWLNALPADIILPPFSEVHEPSRLVLSAISNLKSQISPSPFPKGGQGDLSQISNLKSSADKGETHLAPTATARRPRRNADIPGHRVCMDCD